MSGSVLLVPSQSRMLTLDTRPGGSGGAWPNKNAGDLLDYWLDCTGILRDLGGGTAVALGAPVLELITGDAFLYGLGTPVIQLGMIMWMLAGGTPSGVYQVLATVPVIGNPSRTYTKLITLTMNATSASGAAMPFTTDSGGDTSAATSAGFVSTDVLTQATGTTSAAASVLGASVTKISTSAAAQLGVRMPSGMAGYEYRVINVSAITINFYPPTGLAWSGMGPDVPLQVPSMTQSTGIAFPDGSCVAGS